MSKQNDLNLDMEKYLDRKASTDSSVNMAKMLSKKEEKSVSELYPELDKNPRTVHVIKRDSNPKMIFSQYKKKIMGMLKNEEKEIDEIDMNDDDTLESIEKVDKIVNKDSGKQQSASAKFKNSFRNFFGAKDQSDVKQAPDVISVDIHGNRKKDQEQIEEEIEEEKLQEELEEKKKNGFFRTITDKFSRPAPKQEPKEEAKKVVIFRPQLSQTNVSTDKDMKLALSIAQKYIDMLPTSTKSTFERSGDRKAFQDAVSRLKK